MSNFQQILSLLPSLTAEELSTLKGHVGSEYYRAASTTVDGAMWEILAHYETFVKDYHDYREPSPHDSAIMPFGDEKQIISLMQAHKAKEGFTVYFSSKADPAWLKPIIAFVAEKIGFSYEDDFYVIITFGDSAPGKNFTFRPTGEVQPPEAAMELPKQIPQWVKELAAA